MLHFSFSKQFWFFGPNLLPKRILPIKLRKIEHRYRILQWQLAILIFWTKFARKRNFRSKTEKSHFRVHPWSLLAISNFYARGPTDRTVFLCWSLFLKKACSFIKKRLQRRCFPENIAKFLRTSLLQNTSGGCVCLSYYVHCA